MKQAITGYHQDELDDWVAELACGHYQHVRHNPPWTNRHWVIDAEDRESILGTLLKCKKCIEGAPKDTLND